MKRLKAMVALLTKLYTEWRELNEFLDSFCPTYQLHSQHPSQQQVGLFYAVPG